MNLPDRFERLPTAAKLLLILTAVLLPIGVALTFMGSSGIREANAALSSAQQALDAQRLAIEVERTERSRAAWRQIALGYRVPNARGEEKSLAALFAPKPPPGGAGDCAAPKLLAQAYRQGLKPLALAEFWWGAPPATGGFTPGAYFPACRAKCGEVLPWMMEGLSPRCS